MNSPSRLADAQSAFSLDPDLLNPRRPVKSLSIAFALWKALVFLVIVTCPGPGYDTSTSLLPFQAKRLPDVIPTNNKHGPSPSLLSVPLKFVRWDSIYFVHVAENGYVFEQEWAFGYGYTRILSFLSSVFPHLNTSGESAHIALVAVVLSHISHYLSVLVLYRLSTNVFGDDTPKQRLLCFLSAALHIISPAGAFLSAPYGEALFSFLNISGFYFYSSSALDDDANKRVSRDLKLLTAAVLFSVATTVRSNGILGGILFAYDALLQLQQIVYHGLSWDAITRLGVIVIGGCTIGLGMAVPQYFAYKAFCVTANVQRPWCEWTIPGIYRWVQEKYWDVGFLHYWTVSNIPLFLLAMPMLVLLLWSSLWALRLPCVTRKPSNGVTQAVSSTTAVSLLTRLSVVQGMLAVLAFTSYHVQIINRISSGYPLWYWYLAAQLVSDAGDLQAAGKTKGISGVVIQSMMIYGLIQAILFGSFLPPA